MPEAIASEAQLKKRLKALSRARVQFCECMTDPLRAAIIHRVPLATAQRVWQIPLECAAAGFMIEMCQGESGWIVTLTKALDRDKTLQAAGEAQSLLKALFQLADATEQQIEALEASTRHALNQMAPAVPAV